jgi:hypothetical protein
MTSKYKFQIQIDRLINKDMLLKLLKDLENGVILEFSESSSICTDLRLSMIAPGYREANKKVIKLTNLQRREFINQAIKFLKYPKVTILTISTNEYTASLPSGY